MGLGTKFKYKPLLFFSTRHCLVDMNFLGLKPYLISLTVSNSLKQVLPNPKSLATFLCLVCVKSLQTKSTFAFQR